MTEKLTYEDLKELGMDERGYIPRGPGFPAHGSDIGDDPAPKRPMTPEEMDAYVRAHAQAPVRVERRANLDLAVCEIRRKLDVRNDDERELLEAVVRYLKSRA